MDPLLWVLVASNLVLILVLQYYDTYRMTYPEPGLEGRLDSKEKLVLALGLGMLTAEFALVVYLLFRTAPLWGW